MEKYSFKRQNTVFLVAKRHSTDSRPLLLSVLLPIFLCCCYLEKLRRRRRPSMPTPKLLMKLIDRLAKGGADSTYEQDQFYWLSASCQVIVAATATANRGSGGGEAPAAVCKGNSSS
jgi:hypothetical protein